MTKAFVLRSIKLCDLQASHLANHARIEGFSFVDRLIRDWEIGKNQFKKPGERFVGIFINAELVAVGGLNHDPYSSMCDIGRLRHLYVLPHYRRIGVGRALITELLEGAHKQFRKIRLRTDTLDAGRFYEVIGFLPSQETEASHELNIFDDTISVR